MFEQYLAESGKHPDQLLIPANLLENSAYAHVSLKAKFLYSLMLHRLGDSYINGWINEKNQPYIYFPIPEIQKTMCLNAEEAIDLLLELSDDRGCGLIHLEKLEKGLPHRIYLYKEV